MLEADPKWQFSFELSIRLVLNMQFSFELSIRLVLNMQFSFELSIPLVLNMHAYLHISGSIQYPCTHSSVQTGSSQFSPLQPGSEVQFSIVNLAG